MRTNVMWTLLVALSLAFAGCADDDGEEPEPTNTETGSMTTTNTTTEAPEPEPEPEFIPFYINGTVSGAIDCTQGPTSGSFVTAHTEQVPPEAANRTYTATLVSGTNPAGGSICLFWNDAAGTTGLTGTVPPDATQVTIAADREYEGQFSIYIE